MFDVGVGEVMSRGLGVLALAVGLVAMHTVAGSHDAHAAGPAAVADQRVHEPSTGHGPPALGAPAADSPAALVMHDCGDQCPAGSAGLVEVCLMILTTVAFLLLAARSPSRSRHLRPAHDEMPVRRAATRPLRPPSLSVLCISRT